MGHYSTYPIGLETTATPKGQHTLSLSLETTLGHTDLGISTAGSSSGPHGMKVTPTTPSF